MLIANGCVPPPAETAAPSSTDAAASEPEAEGQIPWAPGEAPENPEDSARPAPVDEPKAASGASADPSDGILVQGASSACTGKALPTLRAEVEARSRETRECYARMPKEREGVSGDLRLNLRVSPSGGAEVVQVLEDTLKVPVVQACIVEVLQRPFDEAPLGGCATFVIPVHLEPLAPPQTPSEPQTAP